jgi:hypothetical protein
VLAGAQVILRAEWSKHAGAVGAVSVTVVAGVFTYRALGPKLGRYNDEIAGALATGGRTAMRARVRALESTGLVQRIRSGTQQAASNIGRLSPNEKAFVTTVRQKYEQLMIFRTKKGSGLGDFIIIDPSNPSNPHAIVLELKDKAATIFEGKQIRVDTASQVVGDAGFERAIAWTASTDQFLEGINQLKKGR